MKKTLIAVVSTVLVCCCVFGGTLAWLMDSTQTVTNTFTVGNVNIKLTETIDGTLTDVSDTAAAANFKMIPGTTYTKDPTVTVLDGSEDCYVFVKVVEANNGATDAKYVEYTIDSNWTALDGVANVYWQQVSAGATLPVLTGNSVTISSTNVTSAVTVTPTLTFTAYAVQAENMTDAKDAWTKGNFAN